MKKILVTISTLLVSFSALAQGTIQFSTFNSARGVNAPVMAPDGTGAGVLFPGMTAQLFMVGPGGAYTPLTPATTFNPGPGAASRYVVIPTSNVIVPGVPAGGSATIVMRIFTGASWDQSLGFRGETAPVVVNNLGGTPASGGAPLQPAVLAGLQGITIPEPATVALGLLGTAALLFRRRATIS
ncbi:MAG TPA: PEP-CTERM sorting domain-containing protein [Verrucomicrobiae bacterium]